MYMKQPRGPLTLGEPSPAKGEFKERLCNTVSQLHHHRTPSVLSKNTVSSPNWMLVQSNIGENTVVYIMVVRLMAVCTKSLMYIGLCFVDRLIQPN